MKLVSILRNITTNNDVRVLRSTEKKCHRGTTNAPLTSSRKLINGKSPRHFTFLSMQSARRSDAHHRERRRKRQRGKEYKVNLHHRLHRSRSLRLFTRRFRVGHFERLLRGLDGVGDGFVHGTVFFRLDDCSHRRRSRSLRRGGELERGHSLAGVDGL